MKNYKPYDHAAEFSPSSLRNLQTCHDDLQRLFISLANDGWDITIICGHRCEAEQAESFSTGASELEWPNSSHNSTPSLAGDVAPYITGVGIPWNDNFDPLPWHMLAGAVLAKAKELEIEIEWGGYWSSPIDLAHWQLVN